MSEGQKITVNIRVLNTYLIIALVVVSLLLAYKLYWQKPAPATIPEAKKAQLTVIVITPPKCDGCLPNTAFAEAVMQLPNVNVTEEYVGYNTTEGKALIEEYSLTRLPAAIVTGETEGLSLPGFHQKGKAHYFNETPPPYYSTKEKRVVGRVSIIYITDSTCPQCFDITQFGSQLKQAGVSIISEKNIDLSSADALVMIENYGIKRIPTMILSPEALEYRLLAEAWSEVGTQEANGMLVFRKTPPPYKGIPDNKVHGLVTITYITDKSCLECYNVSLHKEVLAQGFGMVFKAEKTIDISTKAGKDLIAKYGIKYVPTLLLDKEAGEYSQLPEAWAEVGSQDADGTFVFRNVNNLVGITYKDLTTNMTNTTAAG
ncbi:MAG: hypothetical protein QXT19_04450 [Candidatus Woesearchaeota archaeon]